MTRGASRMFFIDLTKNASGALVLWGLSFCDSLGLRKEDTLMVKSINKFRVNIMSKQNKLQAFILSLHVLPLISKSMSTGFVLTTMMVNQLIPSVNNESMQWLVKKKIQTRRHLVFISTNAKLQISHQQ